MKWWEEHIGGWEGDDSWGDTRIWKQDGGKRRHNESVERKNRDEDQKGTACHLPPSLFFSTSPPSLNPLLLSGSHPLLISPTPLLFSPALPSCPFFTHLPSPLLLLTPSLARLLMRASGTIAPLLPVFGNPGLKQSLFTQAVAQPGPSPSLQLGQDWLSLFHKCYNKPLSWPLLLIQPPLSSPSSTISSTLPPLVSPPQS